MGVGQVARTLNEYTTGYLVFVVLTMGFVIPWLDGTMTNSTDDSFVQVSSTMTSRRAPLCVQIDATDEGVSHE